MEKIAAAEPRCSSGGTGFSLCSVPMLTVEDAQTEVCATGHGKIAVAESDAVQVAQALACALVSIFESQDTVRMRNNRIRTLHLYQRPAGRSFSQTRRVCGSRQQSFTHSTSAPRVSRS